MADVKLYEGCWGVTRDIEVCGPVQETGDPDWPWTSYVPRASTRETFKDSGRAWHNPEEDCDWDIIAVYPTEAKAREYLADTITAHSAARYTYVANPTRWKRFKNWLVMLKPHDKQEAFLLGVVVGLCLSVFLIACTLVTSPSPECYTVESGDTLTPCVGGGVKGGIENPGVKP